MPAPHPHPNTLAAQHHPPSRGRRKRALAPTHSLLQVGRGCPHEAASSITSVKSRAATTGPGCGAPSSLCARLGSFSSGSSRTGVQLQATPPRCYLPTAAGLAAGPGARPVLWKGPSTSHSQPCLCLGEHHRHPGLMSAPTLGRGDAALPSSSPLQLGHAPSLATPGSPLERLGGVQEDTRAQDRGQQLRRKAGSCHQSVCSACPPFQQWAEGAHPGLQHPGDLQHLFTRLLARTSSAARSIL